MASELRRMGELFVSTDRKLQPVTYGVWKALGLPAELVDTVSRLSLKLARTGASEEEIVRAIEQEVASQQRRA